MIQCFKTSKYGTKSLNSLGPKIKNYLNVKFETTFHTFKEYIKTWFRPKR